MMFFIRCRTDDTVLLFTECGSVVGNFDCIEAAEDAARDRLIESIPGPDCGNVVRLATVATQAVVRL